MKRLLRGAFLGAGTLELDGERIEVTWLSLIARVEKNPDGTLSVKSTHHIVGNAGAGIDFTTRDTVSVIPGSTHGVYTFSSQLAVQRGQGRVQRGFIGVEGSVDLLQGEVTLSSSSGVLCASN